MGLVTPVEAVPVGQLGRVHFVGIGGAGMSGIARIMLARGVAVSGSDTAPSELLSELAALGAEVHVGHAAQNLGAADSLVVSTAIRPDNPEFAAARLRGLRVLHRAAALASVMLGRQSIAIAGTHGKTTTTAMLTTVLRHCGARPGYAIGGILAETGLGAEDGEEMFVAEADESDGSFLMLSPDAAIVTNIEADHLDNYASLAEIEAAFAAFARRVSDGGLLVTCADDPGARALAAVARELYRPGEPQHCPGGRPPENPRKALPGEDPRTPMAQGPPRYQPGGTTPQGPPRYQPGGPTPQGPPRSLRVRTYGESEDADYRVTGVTPRGMEVSFSLSAMPLPFGINERPVTIAVPGRHNALNAAAVFAVAVESGFPAERVVAGLAAYRGARRRMELKGVGDGVRVLDSYAHHPTELAADLRAARDMADGGRVIAVFQPHLYSRTRVFAAELGAGLGLADEAVVLDVYGAREDPEPGVTGQLVADAVPGGRARFLADSAAVPRVIAEIARPGDLVLTMGAGNVTVLGPQVVEALRAREGTDTPAASGELA